MAALKHSQAVTLVARTPARSGALEGEVHIDGRASGCVVPGVLLEAALDWRDQRVLITSDDVPCEDQLHIVLLDARAQLLDSATLGAPYSTGAFAGLRLMPPDRFAFSFFGDTEWTVELLPKARWRLPLVSEPRGVSRRHAFTRHFLVRGHPQPQ